MVKVARRSMLAIALLFSIFPQANLAQRRLPTPADMVLQNGVVYTVDAARSWAQAIAIKNGSIVFVGSTKAAKPFIGSRTRVIDLQDKMVLPGFHDSHVHPLSGGVELSECNLNEAKDEAEVVETIRRYALANPQAKWIRGGGFQLPIFPGGNPHKSLLDKLIADKPAYFSAADGHSAWVNSCALQLAGVTKATPNPTNGHIERDPQTGEPTGTLRESAMDLVARHMPEHTKQDYLDGLRRGVALANRFGITSFQEASAGEDYLKAYAELARRGELTARVSVSMYADPAKGLSQVAQFKQWRHTYQRRNLRVNTVKIFADGVIEGHTAALLEPYLDRPNDSGKPNWEPTALNQMIAALDREGFQIHIHAIGDRAVRMTLDAFEKARNENGVRDSRHHMAHIQLINPADIPRFRSLGVIANFQPLWAYADTYITKLTEPVLGAARSRWLYPIASVAKSGGMIACGSDWSVSSMNPLEAMQVAVTRRGLEEGETGNAWIAEELVDLPLMITGYTINGAYVNFQEREVGSLEVGKAADLIVLDRNLFELPKHEIHNAKVLLTLLGGNELYRDAKFRIAPKP